MRNIVYLNERYVPIEEATISVLDRGFLFADSIYDVIPLYGNKPFCLDEHLKRMQESLSSISIKIPHDIDKWKEIIFSLIEENNVKEGFHHIYIQVTRGKEELRHHSFSEDISPTVFVQINPSSNTLSYEELCKGKSAITAEDTRWRNCYIKSTALLPNILFSQKAKESGSAETILIKEGLAVEGASSNLFIVKDSVVITPPLSVNILAGITRQKTLSLIKQSGRNYQEASIKKQDLFDADEVWITSSMREIYPITRIDGRLIDNGDVGLVWKEIIKLYHKACRV